MEVPSQERPARPAARAAGAPGAADRADTVDVVVVGSGYAGAVAALRLAEAGLTCVVLERGRRWPITPAGDTFATQTDLDGRAAWLSVDSPIGPGTFTPFTGVLEAVHGEGITCLAGAGVGGGSLVNNAVMMTPRRDLFDASFGGALDYDEFVSTWYPSARALIGVEPIPDDVLAAPEYGNARQFLAEVTRSGLGAQRPPMAVDWSVVRQEMAGTAVPSAILGHHVFGINSGAKRSVDRTVVAAAEATGRVTVLPLHRVEDVVDGPGGYTVETEHLDEDGGVRARPRFRAPTVVLAAGSLGTSRLLVRARGRGSLPRLNDQVGRHWGTGGDHLVVRAGFPLPDPSQGGPAHVVATDWDNPLGAVTLLSFPLGIPLVGALAREMLAVASPPPVGHFSYDRGDDDVELTWPDDAAAAEQVTRAVQATARRLRSAGPAVVVQVTTGRLTSHALGGAVLGRATGDDGEVLGHPGLYVVDSALIPGSTGSVPPALTVTALAERCVTRALPRITARRSLAGTR